MDADGLLPRPMAAYRCIVSRRIVAIPEGRCAAYTHIRASVSYLTQCVRFDTLSSRIAPQSLSP